jgi:hypothetical protein
MIKPISWAPNYGADEKGHIWSLRYNRELKMWPTSKGRKTTELRINKKREKAIVARLVCDAFHGPAEFDENECHHLNGIGTDDRPENLMWVTKEQHYRLHGGRSLCPTCGQRTIE